MEERIFECCEGIRYEVDLPDGYHFVEGSSEDGVVVEDSKGNQFVRVPSGYTAGGEYVRGFWFSRFEISVDSDGEPYSIADRYPTVCLNFYEAEELAEKMGGALISGYEYNRICMWMVQSGSATFDEVFVEGKEIRDDPANPYVLSKGGYDPSRMKNHIDNFFGGNWIWTTERSELYDYYRIIRGGYGKAFYTQKCYPPVRRAWLDPEASGKVSIRVVIRDKKDEDDDED